MTFTFTFHYLTVMSHVKILVPRPGIEPMPPALEARSHNPWATREVPRMLDIDMYHEKKIMDGDESMFLGAGEGTATVENLARDGVTDTVTLEWRPKVREGLGQADILGEG